VVEIFLAMLDSNLISSVCKASEDPDTEALQFARALLRGITEHINTPRRARNFIISGEAQQAFEQCMKAYCDIANGNIHLLEGHALRLYRQQEAEIQMILRGTHPDMDLFDDETIN